MPNIGDSVRYVPGEDHKLDRQPDGSFPWKFSVKDKRGGKPTPVEDRDLAKMLGNVRAMSTLTADGPKTSWPAVVRGVGDDNHLHLDITYPCCPGVTLHYDNVPAGKQGQAHSWYAENAPSLTSKIGGYDSAHRHTDRDDAGGSEVERGGELDRE